MNPAGRTVLTFWGRENTDVKLYKRVSKFKTLSLACSRAPNCPNLAWTISHNDSRENSIFFFFETKNLDILVWQKFEMWVCTWRHADAQIILRVLISQKPFRSPSKNYTCIYLCFLLYDPFNTTIRMSPGMCSGMPHPVHFIKRLNILEIFQIPTPKP